MTRRFFSGSTLEQAIMLAARHHGVDPDELSYRQVEKRHGFLRSRRTVVIAVDPQRPRREPGAAAAAKPESSPPPAAEAAAKKEPPAAPVRRPRPARAERAGESPPRPGPERERAAVGEPPDAPGADEELLGAAEEATRTLLRFAGIEAEATARSGRERVEVEVRGPDDELLLVEGGKGLLAIQHLLPRMLRGLTGRSSFVRVDSGGFHAERKERLETLARREAEAVRRQARPRTLAPMAPDERRIVHLALADDPEVETESRGGGWHKRIVIRPAGEHGGEAEGEGLEW